LAGGTWQTQHLAVPIEFQVDAGEWTAWADLERFFLVREVTSGRAGFAVVWLQNVYTHPCTEGLEGVTEEWPATSGPREFFDFLAAESPVDWGQPEETVIGGRNALTIERVVPVDAFVECIDGYFPMMDVGVEPPGEFALPHEGQRFNLSAVDVGERTALILAFADDGTEIQDPHGAVNELLQSLKFKDL